MVFFSSLQYFPRSVSQLCSCPEVQRCKLLLDIGLELFWWRGTRAPLMLCGHLSETFCAAHLILNSITTG